MAKKTITSASVEQNYYYSVKSLLSSLRDNKFRNITGRTRRAPVELNPTKLLISSRCALKSCIKSLKLSQNQHHLTGGCRGCLHTLSGTWSDMAVYTGVHSPKEEKKLPVIFAFDF